MISEADDESHLNRSAASFCRHWRCWPLQLAEKLQAEPHGVLAYLCWAVRWRHRLRATNLAEGRPLAQRTVRFGARYHI